jgi:hypothetical protein
MTQAKVRIQVIATIIGSLVFIYVYPRALVNWLGESNAWTSYLYLYGFGLWFFSLGIWLILSTGACQFGRGRDSFWFKVLIGGFIYFALLHAGWIVAALTVPFKGAV